jgi:hypothetical protein
VPVAVGGRDELPLSFNQSGYLVLDWLAHLRSLPRSAGPISFGLLFDGPLDVAALERALNAVVQRHEVLRTAFADAAALSPAQERALIEQLSANDWSATGIFTQRVRPSASISIAVESPPPGADGEADPEWLRAHIFACAAVPFDHGRPPLIRAILYRLRDRQHLLVMLINHLVGDGWSMGLLRRDLTLFYDAEVSGTPAALPDLPLHFGDFAAWQRRRFSAPMSDGDVTYWRRHWEKYGSCLLRPSAFHGPRAGVTAPSPEPGCESVVLGADVMQRLNAVGRRHRLTTYMLCTAAAAALFHACTGRTRLAWWAYCSNRPSTETENVIGWFAQGRVLGIDVDPDETGLQLFAKVRDAVFEMYEHDDVPIHVIWKMLGGREIQFAEAFSSEFVSFDFAVVRPPMVVTLADGVTVGPGPRELLTTWNRPLLGLWVIDATLELLVGCRYSLEEFEKPAIAALVQNWAHLITHLARTPEAPLSRTLSRLTHVDASSMSTS